MAGPRHHRHRLAAASAGSVGACAAIAAREAALAQEATGDGQALFLTSLGVLFPAAFVVVPIGAGASLLVDGAGAPTGERRIVHAAAGTASLFAAFGATIAAAHGARSLLGRGAPVDVGASLGLATLAIFVAAAAIVLAALPTLTRALAWIEQAYGVDPRAALAAAALVVAALAAHGVTTADTSSVLGIFAVLRRPELDLRGVAHGLSLLAASSAGAVALGAEALVRRARRPLGVAAVVSGSVGLATVFWAKHRLDADPALATTIQARAPLGALVLGALHRAWDRDGDGYASTFGGGDCDDDDPRVHPAALDVPGNGIDEDCSGSDAPVGGPPERALHGGATLGAPRPAAPRTYNVLLLTVDAFRFDLGFMGHPRPISPHLDELAERSTVFERGYTAAPMTWQALGALLIGKYPSELGGNERFNHFLPSNRLVTERLRDAGVRTFAGVSQFAFSKPAPVAVPRTSYAHIGHEFDVWDTSADPDPNGHDYEDDAVTSAALTDAAIALLSKKENAEPEGGRFFAWFHYFDAHTAYVVHGEAPSFSTGDTSEIGRDRARYESEIWFVDHHIGRLLDYVRAQPWAERTAIIVTGDHGEAFGEHGMRWHRKELWEELIRVPLIVYLPDGVPKRVTARRSHLDLARTILELEGVAAPEDGSLRGVSLVADLLADSSGVGPSRDVYAEIVPNEGAVRRALITGPGAGTKVVDRAGTSFDLFDLDRDPGESVNLARRPALLRPARERLNAFRAALEVPTR